MLTICLVATLIALAFVIACGAGAAASIAFVLFGDVLVAILIVLSIMKIHRHFKNKKKKK